MTAVDWMDRAALGASFACAVHCLLLPVALAALPALARIVSIPESFHAWVIAFAAPTASFALLAGRRLHGRVWPLALAAAGLFAMLAGVWGWDGTAAETALTVAGGVALGIAHVANWRMRHACAGNAVR